MRTREEKRDRSLKLHLDKNVKIEEKFNGKLNVKLNIIKRERKNSNLKK